MKPVIGVTVSKGTTDGGSNYLRLNESNMKALIAAGAMPVMLPITGEDEIIDEYLDLVDGLYFSGGGDVDPLIFNEDPIKEMGNIDHRRDEFELKLFKKAAEKNMPILGICRGEQVINIGAGGSVYQDIHAQREGTKGHSPKSSSGNYAYHSAKIMKDTKLYSLLGTEEININSYHHQAVKEVADGYKVSALAKDGIIEAIESEKHDFIIGIQWHPELMFDRYPVFLKIFEGLVAAAKKEK